MSQDEGTDALAYIDLTLKKSGPKGWPSIGKRLATDPQFLKTCRELRTIHHSGALKFKFGNILTPDDFVPEADRIRIPKQQVPDPEINFLMGNIGIGNRDAPANPAFYKLENITAQVRAYHPADHRWEFYYDNGDMVTENAYWLDDIACADRSHSYMAYINKDHRFGVFSHLDNIPEITTPCIPLFGRRNYFHFFIDYLPFIIYARIIERMRNLPIMMVHFFPHQKGLCDVFKMKVDNIHSLDERIKTPLPYHIRFREAYVPAHVPLTDRVNLLRLAIHANALPRGKKKIFLCRHATHLSASRILNEEAIKAKLEADGFTIMYAEDYTVPQQKEMFEQARIVVGAHGAGLTNIIFSPRKTLLVELMNELSDTHKIGRREAFKKITAINGQPYLRVVCPVGEGQDKNTSIEQDLTFTCDPDRLLNAINAAADAFAV